MAASFTLGINMLWVRQLCAGRGRAIRQSADGHHLLRVVDHGFLLTSITGLFFGPVPILGGAQFTVGASAPISASWERWFTMEGARSRHIGSQALYYAVVVFIFGVVMPGWTTTRTSADSWVDTRPRNGSIRFSRNEWFTL